MLWHMQRAHSSVDSCCPFLQDMKANGGDFTIAFWIKPLGDVSKLGDTGRFFPSVSFLSKVSPPQHNLHIGYWVNPNGEARINTQCFNVQNKNSFWNVEMKAASNDDWTFIAIAHRNKTSAADPLQQTIVYTNLGTNEEYLDGPTVIFSTNNPSLPSCAQHFPALHYLCFSASPVPGLLASFLFCIIDNHHLASACSIPSLCSTLSRSTTRCYCRRS
jgi:hypothetical protein